MRLRHLLALLLSLLVVCGAIADPARDEVLRLDRTVELNSEFADQVEQVPLTNAEPNTRRALSEYRDSDRTKADRDQLIGNLNAGNWREAPLNNAPSASSTADVNASAKEIKSSNLVQDSTRGQAANWLGKTYRDLQDLFNRIDRPNPSGQMPNFSLPQWFIPLAWALLAGILAGLVTWLIMVVSKGRGRSVKRTSLIAEDEEVLDADEYLEAGEKALAQGKFAESVRMFYLAMLVRLHETNNLEFRRHETNWEHFRRFRGEPGSPGARGFDLREWTRLFDYIWYGHQEETRENAERYRSAYKELLGRIKERAA